jgi:hypothetical protein
LTRKTLVYLAPIAAEILEEIEVESGNDVNKNAISFAQK